MRMEGMNRGDGFGVEGGGAEVEWILENSCGGLTGTAFFVGLAGRPSKRNGVLH